MICSFCGTENREGNKFCGICGVRLERRRAERRVRNEGAHLSCGSCGHVNDQGYKFCGMCGTRIDRRKAERRGGEAVRADHAHTVTVPISVPEVPRTRVPQSESTANLNTATMIASNAPATLRAQSEDKPHSDRHDVSGIRGPSFLGLSDDSEDDPGYLLEEENRSHGGWRLLVLLVVLAAIAGLVFLQYRSSLNAKPAAHPTAPAPQGQNQFEPAAQPQPNQQPSPAGTTPSTDQKSQPTAITAPSVTSSDPANGIDPQPHVTPAKAEKSLTEALDPGDDVDKTADPPEKTDAAKTAGKAVVDVPAEQKPSSTLLRAQQFLQGRGVEQNCEQGLVYLRAAAQKNEPAAAVQMGALYASGHCLKQDRVMAYRWFNSAHELQPANQWIQRNMDQLWGQMSEQERRLAGY